MTLHQSFRILAVSTALFGVPLSGAQAQDADKFGTALKAALSRQNITIDWSSISQSGSQIVLQGVSFGMPSAANMKSAPIGDVTLADVSEEDGGYKIGTVTFPSYSMTEEGMTIDATGITMSGLSIPGEGETDPLKTLMLYDSADLSSMSVKAGANELFAMNDLHVEMSRPEDDNGSFEFSGAAEKFTADLSTVSDPQSKAVIDALGYQTISGFFEMAGSWKPSSGDLQLAQYDISVENAGKIGMTFDLGGYTPAFLQSMQDLQKKMAAQPAGADNTAQGLAVLGLMQQLTFKGMSIRFDDDSLTSKVLDFVAKQQGAKPEDIANQAKGVVPFFTPQLDNPELAQQISTAVNTYMDDPKSIEISAVPAQAMPMSQIAASASANPLALVKTLGISVKANEDKDAE